jgi:four helix bundle protein
MQDYRRLLVWKKAHQHVLNVRDSTNRFPRAGYAPLKAQLIKSCESIPFNIVEGCGARTQPEFARFLDISIKSTSETEYQLELARDYSVMAQTEWSSLSEATIEIRKMLCGLRKRVLDGNESDPGKPDPGKPDPGKPDPGKPDPGKPDPESGEQ